MQHEPHIQLPEPEAEDRGRFNFALIIAGAAVVIVLAGLYFWPGRQSPSRGTASEHAAFFGPGERAYAPMIHLEGIALSRAENFLHQEITTLSGDAVNSGNRALRDLEITVEFSDDLQQVVLRETRPIVSQPSAEMSAGERRAFEISLEHVPSSWNMQLPAVRVSGLAFAK
jgi:hypothetical protein